MQGSPRFSFFRITCEFSPVPGLSVCRYLIVALNDAVLFEDLAERSNAAEIAAWREEQQDRAERMAQNFCWDRYFLDRLTTVVHITESKRISVPRRDSLDNDKAIKVNDGAVWVVGCDHKMEFARDASEAIEVDLEV